MLLFEERDRAVHWLHDAAEELPDAAGTVAKTADTLPCQIVEIIFKERGESDIQ